MTLKFFLGIRIDSNQIESNANLNRIESNPVFLSSNQIELKLERIESNRITLKFDSIRFVRNLTYVYNINLQLIWDCLQQKPPLSSFDQICVFYIIPSCDM